MDYTLLFYWFLAVLGGFLFGYGAGFWREQKKHKKEGGSE